MRLGALAKQIHREVVAEVAALGGDALRASDYRQS
jgi:hypothetical protein